MSSTAKQALSRCAWVVVGGGLCAWVLYTCDCDEAESKGACPPDPHGLPVALSSRWDARPCWWGISRRSMHRGSCLRNFRSRTIPPPLTQRWRSPICKVACKDAARMLGLRAGWSRTSARLEGPFLVSTEGLGARKCVNMSIDQTFPPVCTQPCP